MGSSHSNSIRATHFQRPSKQTSVDRLHDDSGDQHISISNKMVERLVEDAALAGGAAAAVSPPTKIPKGDLKDKIYMEKLKYLDETHSERYGLTVEDISEIAHRIELRTTNLPVGPEPICNEFKQKVIDCYKNSDNPSEVVKCWDTVGEFSKCVSDAAAVRLRERSQKDAREYARRSRHVALAREKALRDLTASSLID